MARVTLEGITKVFEAAGGEKICALSGLNLSIEESECLVILGPSGSGKTTALRLIAGLEEPTSGTISISGKVVNGVRPKDRDVAMVFQSPALYPHMSVAENLGFGLRLRGWPRADADARVREIAELLGLTALLASRPMVLSGGQRQRVAIGRAVVRRSGVLLLDEPLANVDPKFRAQLRTEISFLRKQFGTTMVYVTHDHLEAMMVGDRVAVLCEGVLQQVAEPGSLYGQPANLFVAGFMGSPAMNLFRGVLSRRSNGLFLDFSDPAQMEKDFSADDRRWLRLDSSLESRLTGWANKEIVLGVRPEHIGCAPDGMSDRRENWFRAKVTTVDRAGPDSYLHGSYGMNSFMTRVSAGAQVPGHREFVFSFETRNTCFFDPATGKVILRGCEC